MELSHIASALVPPHPPDFKLRTSGVTTADNKNRQLDDFKLNNVAPKLKNSLQCGSHSKLSEERSRFRTAVNLPIAAKRSHLISIRCSFCSPSASHAPFHSVFYPFSFHSVWLTTYIPPHSPHRCLRHDVLKKTRGLGVTALSAMLSTDPGTCPEDLWHPSGT